MPPSPWQEPELQSSNPSRPCAINGASPVGVVGDGDGDGDGVDGAPPPQEIASNVSQITIINPARSQLKRFFIPAHLLGGILACSKK